MEDERMQQTAEEEGGGFLDGWEEDGPEQTAESPAGGGAAPDEGAQEVPGEEPQPGGEARPETGGHEGAAVPPAGEAGGAAGIQPGTEQPGGGPSGAGKPNADQTPPPPKTWTLNHMGQAVTFGEADIPALAEKALDYDRVTAAYEEARPVMELFQGFARKANLSVPEYVARLRMQAKQLEGLDEAAARRAVEMEDREARVSIQEARERQRQEQERQLQEGQRRRQERVQADIQEFIHVFPDAAREFQNIPKEVWDAVNGGMSLVAAYARYAQAQANAQAHAADEEQRRREAVEQQNRKNSEASTGSMRSAGNTRGPKDPFLEGWDE